MVQDFFPSTVSHCQGERIRMIFSTEVKAITSIEKVRAWGVGYRGLWKWTAGTRKMEVGGRWCSFSSGWFLVSSCYFSGVSMSEFFFQSKLAPLPISPLTVRYCNYEELVFFLWFCISYEFPLQDCVKTDKLFISPEGFSLTKRASIQIGTPLKFNSSTLKGHHFQEESI